MSLRRPFYYGWAIVAVAWIIYGFGISPAYYSWGFFSPEMIEDLGFSRARTGAVFGLFTFLYSAVSPIVGGALRLTTLRTLMTLGSLSTALGLFLMSRADSLAECFLGFSILGGVGIGFSTILPCQTLASNWFIRRRARATAIIFTAGGVVGLIMQERIGPWLLRNWDWRRGWLLIAAISLSLAFVSALFVRDAPERLGLRPDGDPPDPPESADPPGAAPTTSGPRIAPAATAPEFTAAQAIRTPQFLLITLGAASFSATWGGVAAHGRLHLEDLGFSIETAGGILGFMVLMSTVGRLAGSLGDFLPPQKVMGLSLILQAVGVGGVMLASSPGLARWMFVLVGLGFGSAYICSAVVFAAYFGRRAFATTSGLRLLVTGVFNALSPALAGRVYDRLGSYALAFIGLTAFSLLGAAACYFSRPPRLPAAR